MDKETQEKLLEIVRRNYEEIADDFSESRKKALWPELLKLAGEVKDGDSVLDAGCGNGRLLEAFEDKKINYLGVDNSEKLIQIARPNVKCQMSNVKFVVGDILELDKMSLGYFDSVFCIAVLHHIPGEDLRIEALRQLKNKIKENGKIIVSVWRLWNQPKYLKLIIKFILLKIVGKNKMDAGDIVFNWGNAKGGRESERYYHAFGKCELKKIIKKAGLRIEKIYKDKYNYYVIASRAPLRMGHMRIK